MHAFFDTVLLSTAYLPPIEYFAAIANASAILLEGAEMYQKQSYRTRCRIISGNGILVLTVPVLRKDGVHKCPVKEVRIDYSKPWLLQHKRALEAAYMSSPFFEYYADDIFPILDKKEKFLVDMNLLLVRKITELIGIPENIKFTDTFLNPADLKAERGITDLRERIHPKNPEENLLRQLGKEKPYYQVFTNKQGFVPNLSIIDLLCNEGPNSVSFLKI